MTVTDDQIRTALDHRLRTAGLDDPDAIPAPRGAELRLATQPPPPDRGRVLAIAAVVIIVGALAALVATRTGDRDRTQTVPATEPSSTVTSTDPNRDLPPPWPKLDPRPATPLDLHGDPIDSEQEFVDRLPELDEQTKQEAATSRLDVLDQLTGEVVNIDADGYATQWFEVTTWYRDHIGSLDGVTAPTQLDPAIIFTDGSYRIVHRSTIDCSPLADGRTPPACVAFDEPTDPSTGAGIGN